jgi:O-antigen/teichoic acid export membrane protein
MSRLRRVAHSVASGYVVLAVTAVYALASLPLALHYLSKERFGLWSLMSSITGYLSLIDLGMSGSVARLLIDHKDQRESGTYGSLIQTGWLVLAVQGIIIFMAGFGLAPPLSKALAIQSDLQIEFIQLLRWQSSALALGFFTRIFGHLLQAHQRIDVTNYSAIAMLILNFILLWVFFHAGYGVFSLAWSTLLSSVCAALVSGIVCWQLKLFPPPGAWGRASWVLFREIFDYGKDMFLVAVGAQLILTSQTLIITRQLGLAASGAWYAGTRTFNLVSQAIWRIFDVSGPAFSEMIVRHEHALLRARYKALVVLSASVSAFAAVTFALCNSLFVEVYTEWTRHPIEWPPVNDVLLALWMIVMAILHCHNMFTLLTKQIGFMRYVYFVEGLVFVAAGLVTVRWGGLPALIVCSILCSTLFSGAYGVWRASQYFQLSNTEIAFRWMGPMAKVLAWFVPVALVTWWLSQPVRQPMLRLAIHALVAGIIGFYILLRFGLPRAFQKELLERAPNQITWLLKRVFLEAGRSGGGTVGEKR